MKSEYFFLHHPDTINGVSRHTQASLGKTKNINIHYLFILFILNYVDMVIFVIYFICMTGKTYKSILYHVVFRTKYNCQFITEERKNIIYDFILSICKKNGYYLHCIGGIENHVHLLIYISPQTSVAKAIGNIKGATSYFYNSRYGFDEKLKWQRGYGVFTVSPENYQKIYNYINKQFEHHKYKKTIKQYETYDNINNIASYEKDAKAP